MRKALFLATATLLTVGVHAQTIVSTTPQHRNVLIEEYTGQQCQWCPAGHKVANQVMAAHPDHAWAINIHQGYYAQNSAYTTQWGDALANQTGLRGYPAGTVNRHVFRSMSTTSGTVNTVTDLYRSYWPAAADSILAMDSPVNIAAEGDIDVNTRELTLHIEVYYTANSNSSTNYLNVAILQNNVIGAQTGASSNYPEMMVGSLYRHNHMLRDMLTGQWGVVIPATQGTFIDTTITYQIPAAYGTVPVENIADLDVVCWVSESRQEVLNATQARVALDKPVLGTLSAIQDGSCGLSYDVYATVINNTRSAMHGFVFEYNGATVAGNKTLQPFESDTFYVGNHTISLTGDAVQSCATTANVTLVSCQDADNTTVNVNSAPASLSFAEFNIYTVAGPLHVKVGIDLYGSEAGIELVDQATCRTLWHEGPWSDVDFNLNSIQYISQIPDSRYVDFEFSPETPGLYILRAIDSYGDGWGWTNNTVPSGVWVSGPEGDVFADPMGYSADISFSYRDYYLNVTNSGDGSFVGIGDVSAVDFTVYPNPVADRLTVSGVEGLREVSVVDITGRTLATSASATVDVSALGAGVYLLRVATEQGVGVQKFVKE